MSEKDTPTLVDLINIDIVKNAFKQIENVINAGYEIELVAGSGSSLILTQETIIEMRRSKKI